MLPQKDRQVVIGTLAAAAGAGGGTVHAHRTSKAASSRDERGGAIFALRARNAGEGETWERVYGNGGMNRDEAAQNRSIPCFLLKKKRWEASFAFLFSGAFAFAFL